MIRGRVIGEISQNTKIYRIFPRERFFQLFAERKNALVRPTMWEDPFENFILRAPVRTSAGEIGQFGFHKDVYGQCWTLHKASDAMWRIYSPQRNAVRLRTTVGKLLASLCKANDLDTGFRCFIGRVRYPKSAELQRFAQTLFRDGLTTEAVARSLLCKRRAFEHEKEIRLVYIESGKLVHDEAVYKYSLDPYAVFDQIMIDPRISMEEYASFKNDILEITNFKETQIKRSLLYSPPENFIIEIP